MSFFFSSLLMANKGVNQLVVVKSWLWIIIKYYSTMKMNSSIVNVELKNLVVPHFARGGFFSDSWDLFLDEFYEYYNTWSANCNSCTCKLYLSTKCLISFRINYLNGIPRNVGFEFRPISPNFDRQWLFDIVFHFSQNFSYMESKYKSRSYLLLCVVVNCVKLQLNPININLN